MTPEAASALVAYVRTVCAEATMTLHAEGRTRDLANLATILESAARSARDRIATYPPQPRKLGGNDGGLA